MNHYVYLIEMVDHNICKIGISRSPGGRISVLQTANPFTLRFLKVFPVPSIEDARAIEAAVHDDLDCYRMAGEWFRCDVLGALSSLEGEIAIYFSARKQEEVAISIFEATGYDDDHIADIFGSSVPEDMAI